MTKNLLLIVSSLLFCFLLLVAGDWLLQLQINRSLEGDSTYLEAKSKETQRVNYEDKPQIKKALSEGYEPVLYPSLMDNTDIQYPLVAGKPMMKTYFCNEGYGLVRYQSDRFGFRNDDGIWDEKISHVVIGDSFVHGACVPDGSTLPEQLAGKVGKNVLNLGFSSNNPSHYFAYANLFIPRIEPSVVYLVFYANDNGEFETSAIERQYVTERQTLFSSSGLALFDSNIFETGISQIIERADAKDRVSLEPTEESLISRAYDAVVRHLTLPTIRHVTLGPRSNFESTAKVLVSTREVCQVHGCRVVVGFIPNSEYFRPDRRADDYGNRISDLSLELGLSFVDGRDFLDRGKGSADFAPKGPHLSPEGYEEMASRLYRAIR